MNITKLKYCASTNQYLKDHIKDFNTFDVIWTDKQTQGKGRRGHTWFSNQDSLIFSIMLKHIQSKTTITLLPLFMAKILHKTMSSFSDFVKIKWPNDILIQSKKAVGILIETLTQGKDTHAIIGVGINVNQTSFPIDIRESAISIKQAHHQDLKKENLLKIILEQFEQSFESYQGDPLQIVKYCNKHLAYKNSMIRFKTHHTTLTGRCTSINNHGHLIVNINGQDQSFASGEIHQITG